MAQSFIFRAMDLGRDHGSNAAGWWLQESPVGGRSSDSHKDGCEWAADFLHKMDACDPAALDSLPQADLSGEWSGNMTPAMLAEAIGYDPETDPREEWGFLHSDLCNAYCEGFSEACEREIVRELKRHARQVSA